MIDSVIRPGPSLIGHRLAGADESFAILSGDVEFALGSNRFALVPGQAGFVPRGVEHALRVLGNKPARLITVLTPGGLEDFYQEMARRRFRLPEDLRHINGAGKRYGIEFPAPVQKGHE
ncbi:MAG: cupin domain-containing protein [Thalassovita sp.]|nr:cupin domain-containing protein [Thalassovita sp.]